MRIYEMGVGLQGVGY